jgi:hypothetical protein
VTEALSPASRCTAVDQRQSVLAAAPHSEDEAGASPTPEPSEWGIALAELIASRASAMLTLSLISWSPVDVTILLVGGPSSIPIGRGARCVLE